MAIGDPGEKIEGTTVDGIFERTEFGWDVCV
jgi:hypothetical protein